MNSSAKIYEELSASQVLLTRFGAHMSTTVIMLDTEMRYLQVSERWRQNYKHIGQDITEIFTEASTKKNILKRI